MSANELKVIPGFNGVYSIDCQGTVWSTARGTNKKLIGFVSNKGYRYIDLIKNGKRVRQAAHRLVMLTFVGPSNLYVNHKDGNTLNNNLKNLEYVTAGQNQKHAYNTGLRQDVGENHYMSNLTTKQAREIKRLANIGVPYKEIMKKFPVAKSTISGIKHGRNWKHL